MNRVLTVHRIPLDRRQKAHYASALRTLATGGIDFLVGGGFGLFLYLRHRRSTKDLDLFLRASDVPGALACLATEGFECQLLDPTWLAKAHRHGALVDLIFSSYNGLFPVDEGWFASSRRAVLLGVPVKVVAPEEMIISKSFVAARDRFDGADIAWLVRELGASLDWGRIERLMGEHWQVLLWQLIHCIYVFPTARSVIPADLIGRLTARFVAQSTVAPSSCRGPMFDPINYQSAITLEGACDPRRRPRLVGADEGGDQVTSSLTPSDSDWMASATSSGDENESSTSSEK